MPNLRGASPVGRDDGEGRSYAAQSVGGEELGVGVEEKATSRGVVVGPSRLYHENVVEIHQSLVPLPSMGAGEENELHELEDAGRRSSVDKGNPVNFRRDVTRDGRESETVGKSKTSWPSMSANSGRVRSGRETRTRGPAGMLFSGRNGEVGQWEGMCDRRHVNSGRA